MKRVLFAAAVLLVASLTEAQESYCISVTANQVQRISKAIDRQNANVCTRLGLPYPCTQSQACVAAGLPSNCTPAQAIDANARVYDGTTQAGRQEFTNELTKIGFQNITHNVVAFDNTTWCQKFKAATQTQKDQACTSVGYIAGCEPCP